MDSVSVEKLHFIKGNCYIEQKDYANAALELQAAVRLQGAGTESYRSLAIALANDGKLEEAQQELDTLQTKGASSGDCDLVAAEILSFRLAGCQAGRAAGLPSGGKLLCFCSGKISTGTGKRNRGYTDGSSEKPDRPAPHQRMAQIRRKYLRLPDRSFLWLESLA